ncbi:hypothetical protein BCR33DRAFT_844752 [Rhizoclosmatium globosum]|uniref:Zn(2)-C6 fungal-type domain-containing protein n=1 Tax=Rhizoclosmatium globosum TaxID=329046 RepID=A0A1Y2D4B1_9FUNG|nr:hypothetical protein BCR33DRAFT_844752 [Rhizoclosmatium globosum]|eukprot:ORY53415.1 hypothetical protein BCR33DRAFT_844752 [Rhizoclosmatium globosum]
MNPPPYKGPTSCTRCRSLKRKCSFASGSIICDYCLKRETECIVPTPSNPIKSCRRCYKHRKRCEPGDTACKRCTDLGVEDECVYFDQDPSDNDPLIMSPNTLAILDDLVSFDFPFITPPRVSSVLEKYMVALDDPMMFEVDTGKEGWELEDPDMLPTQEDWLLLYNHYTKNGEKEPIGMLFDIQQFLFDFYRKPAVLRLILCCKPTAYKLDDESGNRAYHRARKALFRSDLTPSVDLILTYWHIFEYAQFMGRSSIGQQFLKSAVELCLQLQLNKDPDTLPWLNHLTPRQKEERRRIFWGTFYFYSGQLAQDPDCFFLPISGEQVKAPSQINDPTPIFVPAELLKYTSETFNVLGTIKLNYTTPPSSIQSVIDLGTRLYSHFLQYRTTIPQKYILEFDTPHHISTADQDRFIAQISIVQEWLVEINMNLNAGVCISNRPTLFLSCLPSCHPMYLSKSNQIAIQSAINTCYESAWRIYSLRICFDSLAQQSHRYPPTDKRLYHAAASEFRLFEACIVFWFISCRMDPVWLVSCPLEDCNTVPVREELRTIFNKFGENTARVPLMVAVNAMTAEMQEVAETGVRKNVDGKDNGLEAIEIGLKSMSLGVEVESGLNENPILEPKALLGLLGMELGGNIRWKGRKEESWRLFWKLHN